jgi:hypothetical protein
MLNQQLLPDAPKESKQQARSLELSPGVQLSTSDHLTKFYKQRPYFISGTIDYKNLKYAIVTTIVPILSHGFDLGNAIKLIMAIIFNDLIDITLCTTYTDAVEL